jgi:hypothetical protein
LKFWTVTLENFRVEAIACPWVFLMPEVEPQPVRESNPTMLRRMKTARAILTLKQSIEVFVFIGW